MRQIDQDNFIIRQSDPILVTGATGFIGCKLVEKLLDMGFVNLRCLGRPSGHAQKLEVLCEARRDGGGVSLIKGNLLSKQDCAAATKDVAVIFHLAAGRGEKSFPDAFMNSVV